MTTIRTGQKHVDSTDPFLVNRVKLNQFYTGALVFFPTTIAMVKAHTEHVHVICTDSFFIGFLLRIVRSPPTPQNNSAAYSS